MGQMVRLKNVKQYRGGGRNYYYHRLTKERLPDDDNKRALRVLHINATMDGWRDETIPGSIGDIVCRYRASPDFKRLAASTRKRYMHFLKMLERDCATQPITAIDAAWLYEVRDGMAETPNSADKMLKVLSILLNFAVARGLRQDNPARHVKRIGGSKPFEPWPDSALERLRAEANPRMVWAVELALYTGQRLGDVLAMQWGHIKDGLIEVAQQKTGERLFIPVHPHLGNVLGRIPRVGTNIVHRQDGRRYSRDGFLTMLRREQQRLGLTGLQFHGLRHTAGRRLAEAGATDREIMAILGHRTASMVSKYTRSAEQKRLAQSAILKLETGTRVSKPAAGSV